MEENKKECKHLIEFRKALLLPIKNKDKNIGIFNSFYIIICMNCGDLIFSRCIKEEIKKAKKLK